MNKLSEELVLPAGEDERLIHADDGEEKLPEFEKEKEKGSKEEIKELEKAKDIVDEINNAEPDKFQPIDGQGKKIKGLVEKIILEEDEPEEFDDEDKYFDLVGRMYEFIKEEVEYNGGGDIISMLEDAFEEALIRLEDDDSLPRPELEEAIPRPLVKSYKKARYKGKFDGKTDLQNSDYKEIDKNNQEDLELLKKTYKNNPQSIKLILDNQLIDFRDNGKPDLEHRERWVDSDKAYIRSSGNRIRDTRKMPFSHLVKIADKVYIADEKSKDQELLDKRAKNPLSKNYNGSTVDRGAYNLDVRGSDRPSADNISFYDRYVKRYTRELKELEKRHNEGNISDSEYESDKESILGDLEYYKKRKEKYSTQVKDYLANRRYTDSAKKLQEPFKKYKDLKDKLYRAENLVNRKKNEVERIKSSGSDATREARENLERYKEKLKDIQKEIALCEIRLESADVDDAEAIQMAENDLGQVMNDYNEVNGELNTLLRRNK